jgi:hypothetical protein
MQSVAAPKRLAGLLIGVSLCLGGCAHHHRSDDANGGDDGINAYPTNYKSDILAAMHAYLNDPTGIRDAAISEPAMKSAGMISRAHYMVCLRFNPKKSASEYAGVKEVAAVFLAGRFDQFIETPKELCADATYTPFPELGNLSR